jgi:hypothetical protein
MDITHLIRAAKAASILGVNASRLSVLVRTGRVPFLLIDGERFFDRHKIAEVAKTPRKPGRKRILKNN